MPPNGGAGAGAHPPPSSGLNVAARAFDPSIWGRIGADGGGWGARHLPAATVGGARGLQWDGAAAAHRAAARADAGGSDGAGGDPKGTLEPGPAPRRRARRLPQG
eukprot:gene8180-6531_t